MKQVLKSYKDAEDFLSRFVNYEKKREGVIYSPELFNLEGFRSFLNLAGNPQEKSEYIHIAGTKGKGSVAAMLDSALRNCGLKTGLYTSPHLKSYLERFRINGRNISKTEFLRLMNRLKDIREKSEVNRGPGYRTVFELLTALAFLWFNESEVDMVILETGLGGRLDSTNVVHPRLSVITAIGMEHTKFLGHSLLKIAREKAGIIKQGVPVVVSDQPYHVRKRVYPLIEEISRKHSSPLFYAPEIAAMLDVEQPSFDWDERRFIKTFCSLKLPDNRLFKIKQPLPGIHQAINLQTSVACLYTMEGSGFEIDWDKAVSGIEKTEWPGRLEVVSKDPLVIVDGAHCPLSAAALNQVMKQCFDPEKIIYVLGFLKDKKIGSFVKRFFKGMSPKKNIIFTPGTPRGMPAIEASKRIKEAGFPSEITGSIDNAVEKAMKISDRDNVILVTGSLYHIEPLRRLFII